MRRKKRHDDSHGVPHVDEKWLVSYSDMMTLLFGLFVMLYSFALKNKSVAEAVEKELKKIAEKGFQAPATTGEKAKLEKSTESKLEAMDAEDLKRIIQSLNLENNKLRSQLTQVRDELSAKELLAAKAVQETQSTAAKLKQVTRTVAAAKAEASKANPADATSVIVFAKWTNRSHDVDMTVTLPTGAELNFKNRKLNENDPDEFVNESDRGPGVEMFKTTAPKDGEYTFNISLYNSRGDESANEVSLFVVVNGQEKLLEKMALKDDDENRVKTKKIDLKNFGK